MSVTKFDVTDDKSIYLDNDTMTFITDVKDYDYTLYSRSIDSKIDGSNEVYTYAPFKIGKIDIRLKKVHNLIKNIIYVYVEFSKDGVVLYDLLIDDYGSDFLDSLDGLESVLDAPYYVKCVNNLLTVPKDKYICFVISSCEIKRDDFGDMLENYMYGFIFDKTGNLIGLASDICEWFEKPKIVFTTDAKFTTLARVNDNSKIINEIC